MWILKLVKVLDLQYTDLESTLEQLIRPFDLFTFYEVHAYNTHLCYFLISIPFLDIPNESPTGTPPGAPISDMSINKTGGGSLYVKS